MGFVLCVVFVIFFGYFVENEFCGVLMGIFEGKNNICKLFM